MIKMAQLQHWTVICTTCDSPAEYHCNTCGDILCLRCREIHQRSRGTGNHSVVLYSQRVEPGIHLMAQLQHWTVICTTCDSQAEYYCNTCGDILCLRCREIHQRSRGTGNHSVVPYSQRVEPGKLTGQCDDHPGHRLKLWCQRCKKAACTDCVTSVDHGGHKFVKMAERYEEQRKIIQEEFDNYSKLLAEWEDSLQQFQCGMEVYESDLDELGKEITKAADKVCNQVRSIETTLQKQLHEMKISQMLILHNHENELRGWINEIKQQVKIVENKLRSDDFGVLFHTKPKEDKIKLKKPPYFDTSPLPIFIPGQIEVHGLKTMLGKLTQGSEESIGEKPAKDKPSPTEPTSSHKDSSHTSTDADGFTTSKMSLLPATAVTVMDVLQTDKNSAPHLACAGSGHTWVRTGKDTLQLVDRHGTPKKVINTGFDCIGGLATTSQGELLVSDYDDKSVKSIAENGKVKALFKTTWKPYGVCCLHNGDVVVTFHNDGDGRVVQYSRTGNLVRELDRSHFWYARKVAQNKINKQIYVTDKSGMNAGSPGRLLAFNMVTGSLEYEYTRSDASKFTPCDVRTDQIGHIIITDWENDRIHILDQDGRFLQYMLTRNQGLYRPYSIDTDNDGYVWVSEHSNGMRSRVKLLKYMD